MKGWHISEFKRKAMVSSMFWLFCYLVNHVRWSVRIRLGIKGMRVKLLKSYLPWWHKLLQLPGLWAVEMLHSTATLSSEGLCGLYALRFMHRLNIFLSCFGHSGWAGFFFSTFLSSNPNPRNMAILDIIVLHNYIRQPTEKVEIVMVGRDPSFPGSQ